MNQRTALIERSTAETRLRVEVNLDGTGLFESKTGVPFFDHMLHQIARHGLIDLKVIADGDIAVDCHHTVEDVGIALGRALAQAGGDKARIRRFGHAAVVLEESLAEATLDFCGRPYLHFEATFDRPMIENFATEVTEDFFRAVCMNAGITAHLEVRRGRNAHHQVETLFKAFARALRQALEADPRDPGVPSTKGTLAG